MKKPFMIIGSGGHAKVLINILQLQGEEILGCISPNTAEEPLGVSVIGNDDFLLKNFSPDQVLLVNGIGSVGTPNLRTTIFQKFKKHGYTFAPVIHPSVILPVRYKFGEGVQLMAGSVIQPNVLIEENCIINTGALIDHDCRIGAHVHLAPGTTLSGGVSIGKHCHVGTGATMIQNITVGESCIIGAGTLIVKDVPSHTKALGTPAVFFSNE